MTETLILGSGCGARISFFSNHGHVVLYFCNSNIIRIRDYRTEQG